MASYTAANYIRNLGGQIVQELSSDYPGSSGTVVELCHRHNMAFATGTDCPACVTDATITGGVLQN